MDHMVLLLMGLGLYMCVYIYIYTYVCVAGPLLAHFAVLHQGRGVSVLALGR